MCIFKMFSKVFKVEKKNKELATQQRPSSANEQRPAYYPLLQSSLHGHRKRATVHDTRASSIEKDLDLLELVCRSDSLHKRLDELQAKYERMDNGMEHISRETRTIKESKSEKRNRQKSNLFNSTRISKSFEETEVKKPSFFKRIFGHRLSKSEDDLIDTVSPTDETACQDFKEHTRAASMGNGPQDITPILKERRSASADLLSMKDYIVRPPDKRHSCSVEFADLKDDDDNMDDCVMPPPPPPPESEIPGSKGGGLKRKRVIKMYNLNSLDQKNSVMGSSESCYDSTDSELDARTRRTSECYGRSNHIYATINEARHFQPQHEEGVCACEQYDHINECGRSSLTSCRHQPPPAPVLDECEWPRNEGRLTDSEGEWCGRERVRTYQEREFNVLDGSMVNEGIWSTKEGELRMKADSWSAGEGSSRPSSREGGLSSREGSARKYNMNTSTIRHNPRSGSQRVTISNTETRLDGNSKRSGGVFTDDVLNARDSWDSSPSDGEITKVGTVRRRYSHHDKSVSMKASDKHTTTQKIPVLSPKGNQSPMDTSDTEKQPESSDFAESSDTDIPLSKTSSAQDLPARLPTTASIQELDQFLSAIIHNLEAQLQAGGSISIKPRDGEVEGLKRKRKKRKEEMDGTKGNEPVPHRTKRMSECGSCGRRWVEPRLLPCLHTVCTPCLHARATHLPPTNNTPIQSPHNEVTYPAPPTPYDEKISPRPQSSPLHNNCNLPSSQERVLLPPPVVPLTPTVIPPTPNHSPSTPTSSIAGTTSNINTPIPPIFTSTVTYSNGSNHSNHWNGNATNLSPTCDSSVVICDNSSNETTNNNNGIGSTSQASHQLLNGNQQSPKTSQQQQQQPQQQQDQLDNQQRQQLSAAAEDLDSVIELLTNLSPNSPQNNNTNCPSPRLTISPTPVSIPSSPHGDSPSGNPPNTSGSQENDLTSPASTLDSRCSSRTRSSGRSSSSESANRNKGVWVVWCPECGFEAHVPRGGVECFPLNYILQKQLVLEALNSSSTTVFCDLCHDDVVAEERCDTCPVNLCHLCSRAHTRQRRTAHHNVISLQEARSLGIREVAHTLVCATHGEGEVGWWCRGCQEPLCASCLATLHRGHPTVTVDQEAPHARSNLTSLLDLASTRMGELLSTVEDLTGAAARVQQRGRVVTDQVNAFVDDYIMALEEHRHTLLRQIRQACEHAQRGIVTESQRAGQTSNWLRHGCDLTHDLLHHAGDAETLALSPVVTARLQQLLNEEVRGWTRWERLALLREHRAGKVRGHRLHGVIADTPAYPSSSRLKLLGDANNLPTGSRVSALVVARDMDGQPITHGGEDILATVLTRDGSVVCGCSVRDREDGSYEIAFSPPQPGAAVLKVTIQGAHIQGSPLDIVVTKTPAPVGDGSSKERNVPLHGRHHTGIFHCCTFCSSSGDKTASCACGATMPGGYHGCGHNHAGHPGKKHWSCCAQTSPTAPCTRPPSQYYQVTL